MSRRMVLGDEEVECCNFGFERCVDWECAAWCLTFRTTKDHEARSDDG